LSTKSTITSSEITNATIATADIAADAIDGTLIADDVALGGNPTTTTQATGDNTTRVATTAFVTTEITTSKQSETVADKSASFTVDKTEGTVYAITGAVTITIPAASSSYSGVYFVFSYSAPPTFSGTLLWKSGSAPTLTGRGIVTIFCDAHRWLAVRTSDNMS
jgi:hypothetical protein